MRICQNCGEEYKEAHGGMCLKCYNRAYYRTNKLKIIKNVKKWISNNIERHRAYRRELAKKKWAALTPEQKIQKSRAQEKRRSDREMEKRRYYQKTYYQKTKNTERWKENIRTSKEKRRARENNVINTLTRKEWDIIKKAYHNCCAYCEKYIDHPTQDHVIPISKGGPHSRENIVPACQPCNRRKGVGAPPPEFQRKTITFP